MLPVAYPVNLCGKPIAITVYSRGRPVSYIPPRQYVRYASVVPAFFPVNLYGRPNGVIILPCQSVDGECLYGCVSPPASLLPQGQGRGKAD